MHAPRPTHGRRAALAGAVGLASLLSAPRARAQAQAAAEPVGQHGLPPLGYALDANEAAIDARTMELHHGMHHRAYVTALNAALRDHAELAARPVEALLARLNEVPEAIRTTVRNNAGGHANHTMFWQVMGGRGGEPTGELLAAIDRDLGGMTRFRDEFARAGLAQFGSGWVFVTVTREGRLAIAQRPNQDTPLMEGGRVLLGNDVWEHAYYLRYQNRRAEYLREWWKVVNWDRVAERHAAARAGSLAV